MVEEHSDGDFVAFFKVREPLVYRLVEVDFSLFLQKQKRYCGEILRYAADCKKVVGLKFLFSFAVAYAQSERGELVVAVTDYNACAVSEMEIFLCKIFYAFKIQ